MTATYVSHLKIIQNFGTFRRLAALTWHNRKNHEIKSNLRRAEGQ